MFEPVIASIAFAVLFLGVAIGAVVARIRRRARRHTGAGEDRTNSDRPRAVNE